MNDTFGDHLLHEVAARTAALTGEQFFRELVRSLAATLKVRCAFVSEFSEGDSRVRTLALYENGRFIDNHEYDVRHTPCEYVLKGEIGYYPDNVQEAFPQHRAALAAHHAISYLAVPMIDRQGQVLGHLAAMNDRPMTDAAAEHSIFRILGSRAAAELERRNAERERARTEQRLENVLASAMDAIITIDGAHRVVLFNRAAEQMFRCEAATARGQPIERFLAPMARPLLARSLDEQAAEGTRQRWAPEGLYGLRTNGVVFPIEATVSPLPAEDGCFSLILRDVDERVMANAELHRLQNENRNLQEVMEREHQVDGFVGTAPAMQGVFGALYQVADTDTTVLVTGETGTGKELIARALHGSSARRERPLVPVNCAGLPSGLVESELFGHERGAFTGAVGLRKGRFELAHGGTIFLDEVAELSASAQAKLLRALQEHQIERVGGSRPIHVDVRVIAATNRNLEQMVERGLFRADLYYRLNVFPIHLPPLRERSTDIELLAQFFLDKYGRKLGKPFTGFRPGGLERLKRYHWPGNVRELQNVVERAVILGMPPLLEVRDPLAAAAVAPAPAAGAIDDVLRAHIVQVLEQHRWIIEGRRGAATVLKMKPSTLRYRMKQLGIDKNAVHRSA